MKNHHLSHSHHLLSTSLSLALITASVSWADGQSPEWPFSTSYFHQFKADIEDGGRVEKQSINVRAAVPLHRSDDGVIALSGAYALSAYDFSGGNPFSFATLDPWDDVHSFRLGLSIKWDLGGRWSFLGIPSIRSAGEDGARLGDTMTGGALMGAFYRFGDHLMLGPGFGYVSQIEDDASIFPMIFLKWRISDALNLSTGPAVASSLGPGLTLNWDISDRWALAVGARYDRDRFRLRKDSSSSPGGVGENRGLPVFSSLTYRTKNRWELSLIGGVSFSNELNLSDGAGSVLKESDYSSAPFVGLSARYRF